MSKNPLMTSHSGEPLDISDSAADGSVLTPITSKRGLRRPFELVSQSLMALGALMMFQPFALGLYTYSFIVILAGTVLFTIAIHLPE